MAISLITAAATDLATIGSNLSAAHMVAAAPTVALVPAAADEVSAGVAHLFSQHAHDYQALAGQAAAFHEQFVQNLTASAGSYASIEAAIASFLQDLNVNADAFFSSLAGLTPQQLLDSAYFLLVAPVAIPVLLIVVLYLLYLSTKSIPLA